MQKLKNLLVLPCGFLDTLSFWTNLRKIGNSRVVRMTAFIHFIGYMILFSEATVSMLALSRE